MSPGFLETPRNKFIHFPSIYIRTIPKNHELTTTTTHYLISSQKDLALKIKALIGSRRSWWSRGSYLGFAAEFEAWLCASIAVRTFGSLLRKFWSMLVKEWFQ